MSTGKKPTGDGNPTAGQHTNKANVTPSLPEMASDWHRVGNGYSVAFQIKDGLINSMWRPGIPPARKLRRILQSGKYFEARNVFLKVLAARMGGPVLCLDM